MRATLLVLLLAFPLSASAQYVVGVEPPSKCYPSWYTSDAQWNCIRVPVVAVAPFVNIWVQSTAWLDGHELGQCSQPRFGVGPLVERATCELYTTPSANLVAWVHFDPNDRLWFPSAALAIPSGFFGAPAGVACWDGALCASKRCVKRGKGPRVCG